MKIRLIRPSQLASALICVLTLIGAATSRADPSPYSQAYPVIDAYAVVDLGAPSGVSPFDVYPVAINNNGVIVANVDADGPPYAYECQPNGSWTGLSCFQVAAINDSGDYVGLATLDGTGVTECWTAAGGTVLLQSADPYTNTGSPFASSLTAETGTGTNTTVTVAGVTPVSTYGIGSGLTPPPVIYDPCYVACTWAVNTSGSLAPASPVNNIENGWAVPFIDENNGTGAATWIFWSSIIAMSSSGQYIGSAGVGPAPDPGDPGSEEGPSEGQNFLDSSTFPAGFTPVDVNNNGVVLGTLGSSMVLRTGVGSSNDVILPNGGFPQRLTSESGTDYLILGDTGAGKPALWHQSPQTLQYQCDPIQSLISPTSGWTLFPYSIANINDYGCMVGAASGTDGNIHTVLLLPVSESTTVQNSANIQGWNNLQKTLYSPCIQTIAAVPPLGTLPITVTIWQDYEGSITVKYADTSRTVCNIANYLADVQAEGAPPAIQSGTNAQGYPDCTLNDQPHLLFGPLARKVLSSVARGVFARDFVLVQIGNNSPIVAAESDWLSFAYDQFAPDGNENSVWLPQDEQLGTSPLSVGSNPVISGTNYGGPAVAPPPAQPRDYDASANYYLNIWSSWQPSSPPNSGMDANLYRFPSQQ
jgi:hypothetical protein